MKDSTSESQLEGAVLSLPLGVWVWEFKFDYTISVQFTISEPNK